MTIEERVLQKLRDLPPEKQKEVLDFVDSLKEKNDPKSARDRLLAALEAAPNPSDIVGRQLKEEYYKWFRGLRAEVLQHEYWRQIRELQASWITPPQKEGEK